jgi:hypothetical protein
LKVTTTSRLLEQHRAEEQDPIHLELVTKYKCTSPTCQSSIQGLWCFPIKGTQQHYPINGNIIRLWGDAIKAGETTILNPPQEVWSYINKWLGLNKRGKNLANSEANTTSNDTANGIQQHVSIINQFADLGRPIPSIMNSANRTPSPNGLTLFSSPIPPLDRLASYIHWHVNRSPTEEADFKVAEMLRFTGGACGHEGKLIVLNFSTIMEVGPAHHLIPWCSASVQIRGKPATDQPTP